MCQRQFHKWRNGHNAAHAFTFGKGSARCFFGQVMQPLVDELLKPNYQSGTPDSKSCKFAAIPHGTIPLFILSKRKIWFSPNHLATCKPHFRTMKVVETISPTAKWLQLHLIIFCWQQTKRKVGPSSSVLTICEPNPIVIVCSRRFTERRNGWNFTVILFGFSKWIARLMFHQAILPLWAKSRESPKGILIFISVASTAETGGNHSNGPRSRWSPTGSSSSALSMGPICVQQLKLQR